MLKGRSALITGSTGGIGEAFARALAAQGCNVMMNGPGEPAEVERLRAEVAGIAAAQGAQVAHHPADVGKPAEIEAMMREAERRFGGVDIVINNAVVRHYAPIENFPPEKWDEALAVNLSAAFHTTRLAMPGMKRRDWGRVINMSSIHGRLAVPDRVDYVTCKHALIGMTRTVALEVAKTGVTCNALMPGWVLTPHAERQITRQMSERGISREQAIRDLASVRQPSHRPIMPAEIAAVAVFLCSEAGRNINGACLPVDGGWSSGWGIAVGNAAST